LLLSKLEIKLLPLNVDIEGTDIIIHTYSREQFKTLITKVLAEASKPPKARNLSKPFLVGKVKNK
jgi:hypothetical protein